MKKEENTGEKRKGQRVKSQQPKAEGKGQRADGTVQEAKKEHIAESEEQRAKQKARSQQQGASSNLAVSQFGNLKERNSTVFNKGLTPLQIDLPGEQANWACDFLRIFNN